MRLFGRPEQEIGVHHHGLRRLVLEIVDTDRDF
jgi:hypothetical protein